ncbi:MAG: LysR family transcriptional regulator [Lachnospiraceae bacterium]
MDMIVLQEFVSLVETCSFQETAAVMNVSQSTLTKHIHKLEEELNLSLFDRSTRNVKLNEFSKAFYPYAKHILQLQHEAISNLNNLKKQNANQVTIVYTPILGQYGLVDTISDFTKKYPHHNLYTMESYQPMAILAQRKCDFAFVSESDVPDESFNKLIYKTDHLSVVLQSDHPLANEESVTLEQLCDEQFILHSSSVVVHEETQKFMDLCEAKGFTPNIVAESQFTATMVRYVSAGRGIAVLNRLHIPTEVPNISIVDLSPTVHSYIYLLYARKFSRSAAAVDFLHYVIEQINE